MYVSVYEGGITSHIGEQQEEGSEWDTSTTIKKRNYWGERGE